MTSVRALLSGDHRQCDERFVAIERAIVSKQWDEVARLFELFRSAMHAHFEAEELILFPAFELRTGMRMGPTQVMRNEHAQMRELIESASGAIAARDAEDYSGVSETLLIMMQQHNMKEENVLYPMCDQNLSEGSDALIDSIASALRTPES
jgi:hemerythrin-like domain-containing protein